MGCCSIGLRVLTVGFGLWTVGGLVDLGFVLLGFWLFGIAFVVWIVLMFWLMFLLRLLVELLLWV